MSGIELSFVIPTYDEGDSIESALVTWIALFSNCFPFITHKNEGERK
jgi:hypothetical protein